MNQLSLKLPAFILLERHPSVSLNWQLIFTVLVLMTVGVIMIASASIDFAVEKSNDPWFFVRRHSIYLLLGLGLSFVMLMIPTYFLHNY